MSNHKLNNQAKHLKVILRDIFLCQTDFLDVSYVVPIVESQITSYVIKNFICVKPDFCGSILILCVFIGLSSSPNRNYYHRLGLLRESTHVIAPPSGKTAEFNFKACQPSGNCRVYGGIKFLARSV